MTVQLPTPGEDPWGDELNAAITGLDTRVTAVEQAAPPPAATSRYVPVFIFNGESNSGGLAQNSLATAHELSVRPAVKIWDNAGMASFLDLDIGTNNNVDHDDFWQGGYDKTAHGWELGLANSVEAGEWFDSTVYLIKTGQGGSTISEWDEGDVYWEKLQARVEAALALLRAQGKVPQVYVWYTIGINDKAAGTPIPTWKAGMEAFFVRLRKELGYVPIFYVEFMAENSMDAWNVELHNMAAADNMLEIISSTGATVIQPPAYEATVHWDYNGMKTLAARFVSASKNFGQHEGYASRQIDRLGTGAIGTTPPPVTLPSLTCSPMSVSFTEGGAGGQFTARLATAPAATVSVAVAASGGNATAAPSTLTFTTSDWATTQTVTVTSPNDGAASGNRSSSINCTSAGILAAVAVTATIVDAGVGPTAPVNTALPAISGPTTLGGLLSCSQGSWTQSPASYAYQWKRDGVAISGETTNQHTVVAADQAHTLTCTVTATNPQGSTPATSAGTAVPLPAPPANTVAPAVSGSTATGGVLSCTTGTWSGSPTGYAYQWRRSGTNISGQTTSSYTILAGDAGLSLDCTVTATNPNGSASANSNAVTADAAQLPLTPVTWGSFQGGANSPSAGAIHHPVGAMPAGGMVATGFDLTKAFEVEIEFQASPASETVVVFIDDDNVADYNWTGTAQTYLVGVHHYLGKLNVGQGDNATTIDTGVTVSPPARVKMSKSGNDIVFRYAAGAGSYGAVVYTLPGALTGKTTGYLKCLFAGNAAALQATVRVYTAP